ELRPKFVTPAMVPDIRDLDVALADYPWAVLSATMHSSGEGSVIRALVAIQALLYLTPRHYERYIQLVAASVGKEVMQQVREQLKTFDSKALSAYERRGGSFNLGLEEGLEQGREQGLEQGLANLRTALLDVLEARGLSVDEPARERIAACSDFAELRDLIVRAATISSRRSLTRQTSGECRSPCPPKRRPAPARGPRSGWIARLAPRPARRGPARLDPC